MQYRYNKDTNSLELINRNIVVINNSVPSTSGGVNLTVSTDEEDFYGKTVNLTNGIKTITSQFSNEGIAVFNNVDMEGELTVEALVNNIPCTTTVNIKSNYTSRLSTLKIYGVQWQNGQEDPAWIRTEDSSGFGSCVPYTPETTGSSFFDNLYPWCEMQICDRAGGKMVSIPKFYYKIAIEGGIINVKIATTQTSDFQISPAHMDRGDGVGERNKIYISRYNCSGENYLSKTGYIPNQGMSRSTARDKIRSIGDNTYQFDYLTAQTLWLLYIVEYANWGFQYQIGSRDVNEQFYTGLTDNMPYHTGRIGDTYNSSFGVQYRNIEMPGRPFYVDGFIGGTTYRISFNPKQFSEIVNDSYQVIGNVPSSYGTPSEFKLSSINTLIAQSKTNYTDAYSPTKGRSCAYIESYDNMPMLTGNNLASLWNTDNVEKTLCRSIELPDK